jgi:hypothetical protein
MTHPRSDDPEAPDASTDPGSTAPDCPYCGSSSSRLEAERNGDLGFVGAARWRCGWCRNRWWEVRLVRHAHGRGLRIRLPQSRS